MTQQFRVGHGFDVHRFRSGRKLVLAGVTIPYSKGLVGHSDADVVLHAVINAVLGALGEGDIGMHFPDSDARYKGISSAVLLQKVLALMRQRKFQLVNIDLTIVAQQPKMAPHYAAMKQSLAGYFKVPEDRINVKAATTENLGWVGQGKGMAAMAVALLRK